MHGCYWTTYVLTTDVYIGSEAGQQSHRIDPVLRCSHLGSKPIPAQTQGSLHAAGGAQPSGDTCSAGEAPLTYSTIPKARWYCAAAPSRSPPLYSSLPRRLSASCERSASP